MGQGSVYHKQGKDITTESYITVKYNDNNEYLTKINTYLDSKSYTLELRF